MHCYPLLVKTLNWHYKRNNIQHFNAIHSSNSSNTCYLCRTSCCVINRCSTFDAVADDWKICSFYLVIVNTYATCFIEFCSQQFANKRNRATNINPNNNWRAQSCVTHWNTFAQRVSAKIMMRAQCIWMWITSMVYTQNTTNKYIFCSLLLLRRYVFVMVLI